MYKIVKEKKKGCHKKCVHIHLTDMLSTEMFPPGSIFTNILPILV